MGVVGATGAQVFSFLLVPIVARLFSPEDFGIAATFLAVFAVLSPIASLRYEQAIILPRSDEDARVLTSVAIRILVGVILISILGIFLLGVFPISSFVEHDLTLWVILLPLFLLVSGGADILLSWSTRQERFSHMAMGDVVSTLGTSGSRIGAGLVFGSSALGLVVGNLIGHLAKVFVLWKGINLGSNLIDNLCRLPSGRARQMMAEYRDFPLYSAPTGFVRELKENIPLIAVVLLFTEQAAGFYAMATRLVRLPIAVISMPVRRVYIQRAAQALNEGRVIRGLLLKATGLLIGLGVLPLFVLILYGTELFSLFLGANWEGSGKYAEILSAWFFSIFVLTPSAATFIVIRKQRIWLIFQIAGALIGGLVFLSAGLFSLEDKKVLEIFVFSQIGLNVTIFLSALQLASKQFDTEKKNTSTF